MPALGCAPEQPAGFCAQTSDCESGYACNAFTRTCTLDPSRPLGDYDLWGHFYCMDRSEVEESTDARGYLSIGIDPAVRDQLHLPPTEGYSVGYYGTSCGLGHDADLKIWFTGSTFKFDGSDQHLVLQMLIADDNFKTGAVQTTAPHSFALAFKDLASNELVLSTKDAEIRVLETVSGKPSGVRGELRARRESTR